MLMYSQGKQKSENIKKCPCVKDDFPHKETGNGINHENAQRGFS